MNLSCVYCHKPVDPYTPGTFRKVTGWAEVRRSGGVHALTDRQETGEFACPDCIRRKRAGIAPSQGNLL